MENASEPKNHDTYLRIVDVAKHLFGRVGFQKTTILDISRELPMTPCDVYRFFPSKAELQEAVGRRLLGEIEVAVDHIVKSSDPANEKFGVYIRLCHPSLIVENAEEREATIHHMTNFCLAALA